MNQTSPWGSAVFSSTTRLDGRPSGPTVASVIAVGSPMPEAIASCIHRSNWVSGSSATWFSASSGWS